MKNKIDKVIKNKTLNIIIKVSKALLTIFVLLLIIVIFVQKISNNNSNFLGIQVFTILTDSMYPEYKVNDMIVIKEVDANTLKIGDDVTYMGEVDDFSGKIVTHRIVEMMKNTDGGYNITTKGIANNIPDPQIKDSQILGKVVYKAIILSWLSGLISNIYGFYFFIFLPIVILICIEVFQEINYKKELKNEERDA